MSWLSADGPERRAPFARWIAAAKLSEDAVRAVLALSSGVPRWGDEAELDAVPIAKGWHDAAVHAARAWPELSAVIARVRDGTMLRIDPGRVPSGVAVTLDLGDGASAVMTGANAVSAPLMAHEFGHALNTACRDPGRAPFPEWAREVAACASEALACPGGLGRAAGARIDAGLAQLARGMTDPEALCDTRAAQGLGAALVRDAAASPPADVFSSPKAARGLLPDPATPDLAPMSADPALWRYPLSFYRLLGAVLRLDLAADAALLSESFASYFAAFCERRVEGRLRLWLDDRSRPVGYAARDAADGPVARLLLPEADVLRRTPPFRRPSDTPIPPGAAEDRDMRLGAIVKLLAVSDTHRLRSIGPYLRSDVEPALRAGQCAFALGPSGHPEAFATWALVATSRREALRGGARLEPGDWQGGSVLYVNDFVAPFGTAMAFARRLARGPFRDQREAMAVRRRADASVRKRFSARQ